MPRKRMGFEGQAFCGVGGATATTLLGIARDVNYNLDATLAPDFGRGDGTEVPIESQDVTKLAVTLDFVVLNRPDDPGLQLLQEAKFTGTPIALRLKDYAQGKGFDGDCIIQSSPHAKPIEGEQTIGFTAVPTRRLGRDPQLYV